MIVLKLASSTQLKLENEDFYLFEEQACGITVSSRADLKQTCGDYLITDQSLAFVDENADQIHESL